MTTRIAILIVTHDSGEHVWPLVESLPAGVRPLRPRICVVDNASRDGTADAFEAALADLDLPASVHRSERNLGYTGGNDLAYRLTAPEGPFDAWVLLNPDTIVEPGWLPALLERLEDPRVGIAGSLLFLPDGRVDALGCSIHYLGFGFMAGHQTERLPDPLPEPTYACGAAAAISRACLESVQALSGDEEIFWDDLFLYHDDLDLGWRARLAGFDVALAGESRVIHDHVFRSAPTGAGGRAREAAPALPDAGKAAKFVWMERNRFLVVVANYRLPTLLLLAPFLLATELALLLRPAELDRRSRLRVWADVTRMLRSPAFWRRRRRIQRRRRKSDREILAHFAGELDHPEIAGAGDLRNRLSRVGGALLRFLVRW